jgi:Uma2 family endonuclease
VLVSQTEPLVEVYRRNERGKWELAVEARAGELVELTSLGEVLPVNAIYADLLA